MTTDTANSYYLNRNLSLDLHAGAIRAFIPSEVPDQVTADRISGTVLSARFDSAPMGISHVYPESSRSGSVAIDAAERTNGVLFDAAAEVNFDKADAKPVAVIVKSPMGIVLFMRETETESRKIIMGHDEEGYFVTAKVFAHEADLQSVVGLQSAFDAVAPISSYSLPVAA